MEIPCASNCAVDWDGINTIKLHFPLACPHRRLVPKNTTVSQKHEEKVRLFVRKQHDTNTNLCRGNAKVKMLNMPFVPCRLESCVRVWDEAPAASSPPPAGPSPVCIGEVAGQPRSVLGTPPPFFCYCAVASAGWDGSGSSSRSGLATSRQGPEPGFGVIVKIVSDICQ